MTNAAGPSFRPIHYLGNKWRALDAIEAAAREFAGSEGAFLDLFSGTGVVAARIGRQRPVIAADIQEFARVLASALLMPASLGSRTRGVLERAVEEAAVRRAWLGPLIEYEQAALDGSVPGWEERLSDILENGSVAAASAGAGSALRDLLAEASGVVPEGPETVLSRYYGGIYFSYAQAAALDAIAASVRALPPDVSDTALAALLSTTSQIVSTVGNQFAQPVRPRARDGLVKKRSVAGVARTRGLDALDVFTGWLERYEGLSDAAHPHRVLRDDYRNVLDDTTAQAAVIYADPPYTRDHYSRFYHVLETIALGDEPGISTVVVGSERRLSRGLYRADRHQSPFCIKSEVGQAFRDLIQGSAKHGVPLLLSYSPYSSGSAARPETRLMTIPEIEALMAEHFDRVAVRSVGRIAHSKLNAERLNIEINHEAEVLVIGSF